MAEPSVIVEEDLGTKVRRIVRETLGKGFSVRTAWGAFHYIQKGGWWKRDIGYVLYGDVVCFGRHNVEKMTKLAGALSVGRMTLRAS